MTNLPAPPGYRNRGKGVARHLTEQERRKVGLFASRNGTAKAADRFSVSAAAARAYIKEFGFAFPKRKSSW